MFDISHKVKNPGNVQEKLDALRIQRFIHVRNCQTSLREVCSCFHESSRMFAPSSSQARCLAVVSNPFTFSTWLDSINSIPFQEHRPRSVDDRIGHERDHRVCSQVKVAASQSSFTDNAENPPTTQKTLSRCVVHFSNVFATQWLIFRYDTQMSLTNDHKFDFLHKLPRITNMFRIISEKLSIHIDHIFNFQETPKELC